MAAVALQGRLVGEMGQVQVPAPAPAPAPADVPGSQSRLAGRPAASAGAEELHNGQGGPQQPGQRADRPADPVGRAKNRYRGKRGGKKAKDRALGRASSPLPPQLATGGLAQPISVASVQAISEITRAAIGAIKVIAAGHAAHGRNGLAQPPNRKPAQPPQPHRGDVAAAQSQPAAGRVETPAVHADAASTPTRSHAHPPASAAVAPDARLAATGTAVGAAAAHAGPAAPPADALMEEAGTSGWLQGGDGLEAWWAKKAAGHEAKGPLSPAEQRELKRLKRFGWADDVDVDDPRGASRYLELDFRSQLRVRPPAAAALAPGPAQPSGCDAGGAGGHGSKAPGGKPSTRAHALARAAIENS